MYVPGSCLSVTPRAFRQIIAETSMLQWMEFRWSSTHVLLLIGEKAILRAVKIVAPVIDLLLGCDNSEGRLDEWRSSEPRLHPSELAIVTDSLERRGTPLSNKLLQTLDQSHSTS
jgi:hypothetical protein